MNMRSACQLLFLFYFSSFPGSSRQMFRLAILPLRAPPDSSSWAQTQSKWTFCVPQLISFHRHRDSAGFHGSREARGSAHPRCPSHVFSRLRELSDPLGFLWAEMQSRKSVALQQQSSLVHPCDSLFAPYSLMHIKTAKSRTTVLCNAWSMRVHE